MSLKGMHFKSLEDVQEVLKSTGFIYVLRNTDYEDVTNVLKNFTLRCERYGIFKPRGKTGKATTSKKCGCTALLSGSMSKDDNGVAGYKITHHVEVHNHGRPSVDSDAVPIRPNVHAVTGCPVDTVACAPSAVQALYVGDQGNSNDFKISPLIRQMKYLYKELKVENAQQGFELIQKCVEDLQEYVAKSNPDNTSVGVTNSVKENDDIQQGTSDQHKQDYAENEHDCHNNGTDTSLASSKFNNCDRDDHAAHDRESISKTESEFDLDQASGPQSVLQEDSTAVGTKKVTSASQLQKTDGFKKVATSGRPRRAGKTAIGLERQSMPRNWDDRSRGQQIYSMLNWLPLSQNVIKNVLDREYKVQVKDLKKIKNWISPFLNDRCDLQLFEDYFDKDASEFLRVFVEEAKEADEDDICQVCFKKIARKATECDSCLLWFDTSCVDRPDKDEEDIWFCPKCRN